jgi:hypothetical protein
VGVQGYEPKDSVGYDMKEMTIIKVFLLKRDFSWRDKEFKLPRKKAEEFFYGLNVNKIIKKQNGEMNNEEFKKSKQSIK